MDLIENRNSSPRAARWQVVHGELVGIAKRRAALDAEEARMLREAEQLQIWKQFGMVSMLDYMERTVGYAPRTGFDRLRVARVLADLPVLTEALANGDLAYSAVRELVRVATPTTESSWRHAARGKNLREIERLVAGHRPGDRPDDPTDEKARLHRVAFEDVDASAFALLRQARQILDDEHGTRMSDSQVVAALASAIVDGASSSEHNGRAKNQIAYAVCSVCDRATQDGGGAPIFVDAATLEQARCDAQHIGSIDNPIPERATQDIPPATVRFVWRRDESRCQTPGCRSCRGLEIHHIVARADGGSHEPSNLTLRCSACHRAHHTGLITISGTAPHALVTTRNVPIESIARSPGESPSSLSGKGNVSVAPIAPSIGERIAPFAGERTASIPSTADAAFRMNEPVSIRTPSISSKFEHAKVRTDLIATLKASGWKSGVASHAVDEACAHVGTQAPFAELLRESFRRCAKR